MQSTIRFVLGLLMVAACTAAAGCSTDDTASPGTAGAAGASGSASGGASGNAGAGGRGVGGGGVGGSGGGEDAAGGDGGQSVDASGESVDASIDGGADVTPEVDNAPDAVDTDASEAGDEVSDGDGAHATRICIEKCTIDDDCKLTNGATRFCNQTNHHCVRCLHDIICVAQQSLWTGKTCTADADCMTDLVAFGDYCVEVEGTGYCAFANTNVPKCTDNHLPTPFTIKKFGSEDMVEVCTISTQTCDQVHGLCAGACTATNCTSPARGGKVCSSTTMRCACVSNDDCGPGAPSCNGWTHQCECGSTTDCASDTGRTVVCD